jgi:hypothetical protein
VNGKASEANVAQIREIFANHSPRFWHARLILVQALLADAWKDRDGAVAQLEADLARYRSEEEHALVGQGIDLAREGIREFKRSRPDDRPPLTRYMWTHEREAVRWVDHGKHRVTQLAADVVLLLNMTYRLRSRELAKADEAAVELELPRCISVSGERRRVMEGCGCGRELCARRRPPVVESRAPFSESFCREQVRLIACHGPPPWTRRAFLPYGRSRRLKKFWDRQAEATQPKRT